MDNEYIICAAIWYDDGISRSNLPHNINSGLVAAGWRHHNCYTILWSLYPNREYLNNTIQGFLTSKGNFYNREESMKIAKSANQLVDLERIFDRDSLYSEDLY